VLLISLAAVAFFLILPMIFGAAGPASSSRRWIQLLYFGRCGPGIPFWSRSPLSSDLFFSSGIRRTQLTVVIFCSCSQAEREPDFPAMLPEPGSRVAAVIAYWWGRSVLHVLILPGLLECPGRIAFCGQARRSAAYS